MRFPVILLFYLTLISAAYAADAVPAAAYFPVLALDAATDEAPQLLPVAANHDLAGAHAGITRAIVVVHDDSRDAGAALATITALAGAENATTMIAAPQFLLASDLIRFADHLPDRGQNFAVWQPAGWAIGDDSSGRPGKRGISSFTVADLLLLYLGDHSRFPDLKTIILAGYGSGAVFVQRYAAFSMAANALDRQDIDLRFIVAAAPSYLYLTATRAMGGRKGFGVPDTKACPDYDAYSYGLNRLNPYARRVGANAAKADYPLRFITYLNAPGADTVPEESCAALAQGADVNMRAANFRLYLNFLYGDTAARTQVFSFAKDAKNDAVGLYGSACGMEVLFGDGLCPHRFGEVAE